MHPYWHNYRNREQGVTLLEVLVTILIVTFGLLGLAGLQARIQAAEIESYQRVQALVLLQDMVDRISANRKQATSYGVNVGTGGYSGGAIDDCTAYTAAADLYRRDLCEWNNALIGAAENNGTCTTSNKSGCVGAMMGGRGCITNSVATMPYEFVVSVAWQGLTPTSVPTVSTCGQGQYGTNDAHRRVVSTRVVFSCLLNLDDGVTCASATP